MLTFPDIAEPNTCNASNCGDSYRNKIADSTVITNADANYKQTRPRTTRMIASWSYSWVGLSDSDFTKVQAFFNQVGRFASFSWVNPTDDKTYTVRITNEWNWQLNHPIGWQGSFTFEEV